MGMHPGVGLKASNIKGLAVLHFAFGARISFVWYGFVISNSYAYY